MINKEDIISFFDDNDLEDIKEIKFNKDFFVFRFKYKFDNVELEAAEVYANEECEERSNSEEWNYEFFLPYLNDIAVDNATDIIEECAEEMELEYEFIALDVQMEAHEYDEFLVSFHKETVQIDLENYLQHIM